MSMSQTDPATPGADETVDDNLIDAERQALKDTTPDPEPATPQAAPAAPDPEPAAPAPEDRLAAAADKLGEAAERLAARAADPEPAPAQPAEPEQPPRDFAAELAKIDEDYENGDIDLREYTKRRDDVRDAQSDARLEAALAADRKAREDADAQRAADLAKADWTSASTKFFEDPANAALVDNPIKTAAFQAAIHEAAKTVPANDYPAVLAKARELVGGAPGSVADDKVRDAKFQRASRQPEPAQTLRDVPDSTVHDTPGAALDGLDIDTLEDKVMQMTPEARDRWLASAPGGLGDNPRRAE